MNPYSPCSVSSLIISSSTSCLGLIDSLAFSQLEIDQVDMLLVPLCPVPAPSPAEPIQLPPSNPGWQPFPGC